MKKKKEKGDFELKLYKFLGVELFRKLVFKLEKFIHRKDGGKNINYHVEKNNVDNYKSFKKYLYYNGNIHVRNVLKEMGTLLVLLMFFNKIAMAILLADILKNLYCVMLQRYNYIRINQYVDKKENSYRVKDEKRQEEFAKTEEYQRIDDFNLDESISRLDNIKLFLQGKEDVILTEKDKEILELFLQYLDCLKKNKENETSNNNNIEDVTLKRERRVS